MRYRHLRRTVIAVLATVAFVLICGMLIRAILVAEPTRRAAIRWIEKSAADMGAEVEIGDFQWKMLPPGVRLDEVRFRAPGIAADVGTLHADLSRLRLTRRTIVLGTVAARGVRLSLDGLPESTRSEGRPVKVRIRHLELDDVQFQGVDLPGGLSLDLEGVRGGWTGQGRISRGYAEIANARVQIGTMAAIDTSLNARFELSDEELAVPNFLLESVGITLRGHGRIAAEGTLFEARGPLDITWLDGFIKTKGLLEGSSVVEINIDTRSKELLRARLAAPLIDVAGFPLRDLRASIALVGNSLLGNLDRARFHGGTLSGTYRLAEFGGGYPHAVELQGQGISLAGFLGNLRVEPAGLAATIDLSAAARWNGRAFPSGLGQAGLEFHAASPGIPVEGPLTLDLNGEGIFRFNSTNLFLGGAATTWQGALTIGTWEPAWSISSEGAEFATVASMVNAWVGSNALPPELEGTGDLEVSLSGPFSDLTVQARIDAQPLRLPPITFDRLVADATISRSLLRIGSARFQIAEGLGEIEGGMTWDAQAGDNQLNIDIRGNKIPLVAIASWIDLEESVDSGLLSFDGDLSGPIALPRGSWVAEIDNLSLGGIALGNASTELELADARFSCSDLRCDRGLEARLWWDVTAAEVAGSLNWPGMPLAGMGEPVTRLAGPAADVVLDFHLPIGGEMATELTATSERGRLAITQGPETVDFTAEINGAASAQARLERTAAGDLHGRGEIMMSSANELLALLGPDIAVPLAGTGRADFSVDWGDETWPRLAGTLQELDLSLADQPVQLVEPADFSLSADGFTVPGLRLRARDDELFVRWAIDDAGLLRGNVSGTMDTLLLRFLLPDWEPAGRATGVVEMLGSVDVPLFEGIAEFQKGSFRLPGTRTILSQVEGVVLLSSGEVQLEGMSFRIMGGRGRCSGRIRQDEDTLFMSLDGTAEGVRFEVLPDMEARLSGTWHLVGPVTGLNLSGDLDVDRMSLNTKDDPAALLVRWMGESGRSAAEGGLSLNLHVEAEETLDLHNPFVRLTGSASLDVSGTSNQPGLVGQVEILDGGEVTLLGNRYEVERGSLTFSNPQGIEPFLDLQASTWAQEYQITVNLSGTFDRFVSTAVSTPPLSSPEIYSLLGVGYRSEAHGTGAMGLGLASSILANELTSVLSQRGQLVLPIDQVRVDPFAADSTGNPTARLSVVKQLTPSWTVILQTTLSGEREQIVVSRWYLAPGLFLEGAQHEDGSLSLDLKLRRPY
ncbi:MAG: translocation/assembly module TamB domain-containing protein [Acidobacteriota bacterium]|nr:translocation/assembly module TamB domain-containing protein [Acidobacteriota bacterium]